MEYLTANEAARYCLVSCLGRGSSATVFKALRSDPISQIEQPVAVKILHSETDIQKWRAEFYSLFKVESQHCVRVYGFDRIKGRPALVLELVDGASLHELLMAGMDSDVPWLEVARQVSRGLIDLHRAKLIHGDLSPANILIRRDGLVKLADFGLANGQGREAEITPEYAAPEVLNCLQSPDAQSDWYSLAKILWRHGAQFEHPWIEQTLAALPGARLGLPDLGTMDQRHQLGILVQRYLATARRPMTQKLNMIRGRLQVRRWWRQGMGARGLMPVTLLFFLIQNGAEASRSPEPFNAHLTIRSKNWVHVRMNGQEMGYAPLSLRGIKAGIVRLEFTSARRRQQRILTLSPGSHMVISDFD